MAQKRIKMVQNDILSNKIKLLYDDDSRGELDMTKCHGHMSETCTLVGLTLKQAKMKLGMKD